MILEGFDIPTHVDLDLEGLWAKRVVELGGLEEERVAPIADMLAEYAHWDWRMGDRTLKLECWSSDTSPDLIRKPLPELVEHSQKVWLRIRDICAFCLGQMRDLDCPPMQIYLPPRWQPFVPGLSGGDILWDVAVRYGSITIPVTEALPRDIWHTIVVLSGPEFGRYLAFPILYKQFHRCIISQ